MSESLTHIYWFGSKTNVKTSVKVLQINELNEISLLTSGVICFDCRDDDELKQILQEFYQQPLRWAWAVYTVVDSNYSQTVTDGVFDEQLAINSWQAMQRRLQLIKQIPLIDPLIGWLGISKTRSLKPFQDLAAHTIYSYPIIELLIPDLYSSYRYALSQSQRGMLESEALIDRIRICANCTSAHLNYVDVCPNCHNIDIESQSSLHCFTCGYVGDQSSFQRQSKLECPKCLTQLRHIGVDYDRPLENHKCNHCSSLFVEATTISRCMSCEQSNRIEDLVIRKLHQYKLGELGEYNYVHGASIGTPELSIKGKVEAPFFESLVSWLNKVSIRHHTPHMLLCLHLPSFNEYALHHGDGRLFSLVDQLTERLGSVLRNTDLCCQYKSDILLVLMPYTHQSSLSVLMEKFSEICELIEEEDFELNAYAWDLPDESMNDDITSWFTKKVSEIYASR